MRPLLATITLALFSANCAFVAKTAGVKVNGKEVGSNESAPTTAANKASAAATPAKAAPKASPLAPKVVEAAPAVSDSVSAIPDSLKVTPTEGAPVIALQGVPWCSAEVKGLDWDSNTERRFTNATKNVGDMDRLGIDKVRTIARFACGGTKSADRLTWVESYMQAFANNTGIKQDHLIHLMGVTAGPDFDAADFVNKGPEGCEKFKVKRNLNSLESQQASLLRVGTGCAAPTSASWISWWIDRDAKFDSQVRLLGWLYASYGYTAKNASFNTGVMALRDLRSFDQNALFTELQELGADEAVIAKAIILFYKTKGKYEKWVAHHQEELGDDYQALVSAMDSAYATWEKAYKQDKEAVDFAFGMEAAVLEGDKRAFQGCSERARKLATEFVMRDNPKNAEDIKRAAAKPIGALILAAAYECEKAQGNALMATVFAEMLKEAPISRGPRFAAQLAVAQKVAELKEMKSRFPLRARDFSPYVPNEAFGKSRAGYFVTGSGVVSKVQKQGETMTLSFKKESWKQDVFKCKETYKIDRIENGKIIYRKKCHKTGTETITSQEKPVTIPAAAGAGIKAGSFVVAARDRKDPSKGLPRQVYKSKKRDKLVNYYGLSF